MPFKIFSVKMEMDSLAFVVFLYVVICQASQTYSMLLNKFLKNQWALCVFSKM